MVQQMSPELQQAIARRGGLEPGTKPSPSPTAVGQRAPQPVPAAVGASPAGSTGTEKPPVTEAEIILKAMDARLKAISTVEKAQLAPETVSQPSPSPLGGGSNKGY
jgi:hypothetical protein